MRVKRASVSQQAEADIDGIAAYTTESWGWQQTERYLSQLEGTFLLLARNPSMGRSCDAIHAGMRRFQHGNHVVF